MHIKPDDESERYGDFLQQWKLMQLIKKYSNYIRWPIQMDVKKSDFKETGGKNEDGSPKYETVTTTERETVNSMVPIWQRSKSEVSDEDCVASTRRSSTTRPTRRPSSASTPRGR